MVAIQLADTIHNWIIAGFFVIFAGLLVIGFAAKRFASVASIFLAGLVLSPFVVSDIVFRQAGTGVCKQIAPDLSVDAAACDSGGGGGGVVTTVTVP